MRTPDDPDCPFELEVSHREHDALEWLLETCRKISENPKSCNRVKAALAAQVIEKMRDQLNDNHAMLHDQEVIMARQEAELAQNVFIAKLAKYQTGSEGTN
jgi:hypothetical protein